MIIARIAMFMGSVEISGWFKMSSTFRKYIFRTGISLSCFAFLVLVFLILPPIGRHYHVPAASMFPTLIPGDIIYSSNYGYTFSDDKMPQRGDIITFIPEGGRQVFVKRVVAMPGDRLQIRQGRLYLNDTLVERKSKGTERLHLRFKREAETYALYEEQFAEDMQSFQIFEKSDNERLDSTPIFTLPKGCLLYTSPSPRDRG